MGSSTSKEQQSQPSKPEASPKPTKSSSSPNQAFQYTSTNAGMRTKTSSIESDECWSNPFEARTSEDNTDDCQCFSGTFGFWNKSSKRSYDPIGTPLPDTVEDLRRKRMSVGAYGFLEREPSERNAGAYVKRGSVKQSRNWDRGPIAEVHEGPTGEKEFQEKYEMFGVLGVGSTATCYRCVNRQTKEQLACKIIDKQQIQKRFSGMLDQFHEEILALRSLRHPNIIRLYDVYITEEKMYIVTELMEGGELFDYVVQKGTLTEEEASSIVRKVTSALLYMHSKNIIHRDLKPENLLMARKPRSPTDDIQVKIIDFGLSKHLTEPVASSFLGTRGYLAPEMLQRRNYDKTVDVWAMGVIVFVLLCGCLPFDDDPQKISNDEVLQKKFVLRYPRWAKNLSSSAKDLLSHLLDIDPFKRYTAEQALEHPWVQGKDLPTNNYLKSPKYVKSPQMSKGPPGRHRRDRSNDGGDSSTAGNSRISNGSYKGGRRPRADSADRVPLVRKISI